MKIFFPSFVKYYLLQKLRSSFLRRSIYLFGSIQRKKVRFNVTSRSTICRQSFRITCFPVRRFLRNTIPFESTTEQKGSVGQWVVGIKQYREKEQRANELMDDGVSSCKQVAIELPVQGKRGNDRNRVSYTRDIPVENLWNVRNAPTTRMIDNCWGGWQNAASFQV